MSSAEQEEYRSLRATIRERGTARIWVFVIGIIAWGALITATAALASLPVATLLPLLVLVSVFEAVFSLHVGVERIGRYIQVFLEHDTGWEHAAMAFGQPLRGTRVDPLHRLLSDRYPAEFRPGAAGRARGDRVVGRGHRAPVRGHPHRVGEPRGRAPA